MTDRDTLGAELPKLSEFMLLPGKHRLPLPDVAEATRTSDTAASFLHALFLGAARPIAETDMTAIDTYLRENDAGFVRGSQIYLYPRQSLHVAKSNARKNNTFLSASAQRVESALLTAGWRCPNPGMEPTVSIVECGKRRTAWELPASVYTNSNTLPTPAPATPVQTLRALCRIFTIQETVRLLDVRRGTLESWIYTDRSTPDRITNIAVAMYGITTGFLLTGHRNPLFWLRQPSTALRTAYPHLGEIPRDLLLAEEFAPVLEAATFAFAAGDYGN